jgi:hypothetical protein
MGRVTKGKGAHLRRALGRPSSGEEAPRYDHQIERNSAKAGEKSSWTLRLASTFGLHDDAFVPSPIDFSYHQRTESRFVRS